MANESRFSNNTNFHSPPPEGNLLHISSHISIERVKNKKERTDPTDLIGKFIVKVVAVMKIPKIVNKFLLFSRKLSSVFFSVMAYKLF